MALRWTTSAATVAAATALIVHHHALIETAAAVATTRSMTWTVKSRYQPHPPPLRARNGSSTSTLMPHHTRIRTTSLALAADWGDEGPTIRLRNDHTIHPATNQIPAWITTSPGMPNRDIVRPVIVARGARLWSIREMLPPMSDHEPLLASSFWLLPLEGSRARESPPGSRYEGRVPSEAIKDLGQ